VEQQVVAVEFIQESHVCISVNLPNATEGRWILGKVISIVCTCETILLNEIAGTVNAGSEVVEVIHFHRCRTNGKEFQETSTKLIVPVENNIVSCQIVKSVTNA